MNIFRWLNRQFSNRGNALSLYGRGTLRPKSTISKVRLTMDGAPTNVKNMRVRAACRSRKSHM